MATPVLNNGLFVRDTEYTVSSHIDSFHLRNMLGDSKPTDLGPVDLWAMAHKAEMPLYQMANFSGKNVKEVTNMKGEFTWQTPVVNDLPYIVEDIENPSNTELGIDGNSFKLKINKRVFGHGDIITYDKYNGAEFYITNDDMLPAGDGIIVTVQLVNNDTFRSVDRKYIKPGTKLFRKGSAKSPEYAQRYSEIGELSAGYREYYNFVGHSQAHTHYSVSNRAQLMMDGGITAAGALRVTELWRTFDENLKGDPTLVSLDTLAKRLGKEGIKKGLEQGTLSRTFVTNMEAAHLTKIANDIELYLMWGKGGRVRNSDGPDDIRLSVGLWAQLDNSYKRIYNKGTFSLELFRSEIFNFYSGKVDFKGPDPNRTIVVQTGLAGMKQVTTAIQHEARGANMVMNAHELGAITGQGMNLSFGFAFTSFKIPYLANVQFVLNPAFDALHTNDIENPVIDGFPLSSYNYIVFDIIENSNDNIYLLKLSWDHELRWFYQNGTMDYMGRSSGFQSSGMFSGYKVFMEQTMPAIWVKDPTKVLKIVMKNPVTGGSF